MEEKNKMMTSDRKTPKTIETKEKPKSEPTKTEKK